MGTGALGMSEMFPNDDRLRELSDQLRPLLAYGSDPDDERRADLVQEIRCHMSEVYRLHRRLLRNRRVNLRSLRAGTLDNGLRIRTKKLTPQHTQMFHQSYRS